MEPLFFASIGFAIPFVQLWTGKRIWRGVVYSLLMTFAKVIHQNYNCSSQDLLTCIQLVVGIWLLVWKLLLGKSVQKTLEPSEQGQGRERRKAEGSKGEDNPAQSQHSDHWDGTWLAAFLLGSAMVARGEIGLLIIEIGHNETPYVSDEGFITGVWAILLNTIIGPITVGILARNFGKQIGDGKWGIQELALPASSRAQVEGCGEV